MTWLTLSDRQSISELLSQYGLLIDQGRLDEWTNLFLAEAEFLVPGSAPLVTAANRRQLLEAAPRGLHLSAPAIVREGPSEGTALSEQSFMFRNSGTGEVLTGWYDDVLARRDERWYLAKRVIHYFGSGPAPR